MNVNIRIARKEDAAALLGIYSYYVKNTAVSFECKVPSIQEFEKRICTTLENYPYLVAELNGKIAGYVYASRFSPRSAYDWVAETSIYIDKDLHHQGLGKILYEKLEEFLEAQNVTNLYAGVAEPIEKNDEYLTNDSELFHQAVGYKTIGRFSNCGYKFNHWYNLIYMEKMIGEHCCPQKDFIPFSELEIATCLN